MDGNLNDICRICLSNKSQGNYMIFCRIEDLIRSKFEEVTQMTVGLRKDNCCF